MRQTGQFVVGGRELRPHDHVAYAGNGSADFSRLAMHVVASASPDERVVICADTGWEAAPVLDAEIAAGRVLLVPVTGAYDAVLSGVPDATSAQLRTFETVVDAALRAGHSSVRVVADNTAVLAGSGGTVDRWLAWEQITDRWQAEQPVTGVCWFDRDRVATEALAAVARRHPLLGGSFDEPTWFVHHELLDGVVTPALVGAVEAFDADEFGQVVDTEFAVDADPVLDLTHAAYLHHRALQAIGAAALRRRGRPARLTNAPGTALRLHDVLRLDGIDPTGPAA